MLKFPGILYLLCSFLLPAAVLCQISSSTFSSFPDVLSLGNTFDPIIEAYWTGLPHHRRTPFSVSPDGKSAYLAYLSSSKDKVFIQQVDPSTFKAVGAPVKIDGSKEAGGLVAQNDGFAVLVIQNKVATIVRYKDGSRVWATPLSDEGTESPDMNGDLVYSAASKYYAAYFVISEGGHFSDSIQYVDDSGRVQALSGASSRSGCSHNTGIAFEAANAPPFASICAEDHGAIWLNTDTQTMDGIKIANENTTNGVSGEPMGGMSGSYSSLANFPGASEYIFAWQSRGAVNLTPDGWRQGPYVQCSPRWLNHNVAISILKDKSSLLGPEAISTVGAPSGDDQVTWITKSETTDHQNVHVEAFDSTNAVVTWEELENPDCQPVPLGCSGTYSGTFFQQVNSKGEKVGGAFSVKDAFVSGDMQRIPGKGLCWPYVKTTWDLSGPKSSGTFVTSMSFACVALSGGSAPPPAETPTNTPTASGSNGGGGSPTTSRGPGGSPTPTTAPKRSPAPTNDPAKSPTPTTDPEKLATPTLPPTSGTPTCTTSAGNNYFLCSSDSDCPNGKSCMKYRWGSMCALW